MVVRRRATVVGAVCVAASIVAVLYGIRFAADRDLASFLLCGLMLVVTVVHAMAWSGSRAPLLIADMTGLRLRLGGEWAGLPWGDLDRLELTPPSRWSDGRLLVIARDERRATAELGRMGRAALALNHWIYDAPLVVGFGLTTSVSVDDVSATLERLADGRVPVVAAGRADRRPPVAGAHGDQGESDDADFPVQVRPAAGPARQPRPERPARPGGFRSPARGGPSCRRCEVCRGDAVTARSRSPVGQGSR